MQFHMKEEITEYESTDDNYPYPVTNIGRYSFNGPLYLKGEFNILLKTIQHAYYLFI